MNGAGTRLTIFVSGMVAGDPHQGGGDLGGAAIRAGPAPPGHDVYLVEPVEEKALRPTGAPLAHSVNAAYFTEWRHSSA